MREAIAWMVCLFALCVVTALSYLFAVRHNLAAIEAPVAAAPVVEQKSADASGQLPTNRGGQVFAEQKCQTCHSIGGVGNPRSPLDAVASRRSQAELREWITATGAATNSLSGAVIRRKRRYLDMPESDLAALVEFVREAAARH